MKFSVTLLLELVSVAPEAFEEIAATCPSVIVDIRNPTATVANLKAAAAVKLKLKDPNQFRLVALVLDDESKKNKAQILDANDTSKKCLLSTIFPSESADVAIPLYCVKAADCESCALDTLIHGGKVVDAVSLAINGSASSEPHAAKRGREEAVDGGDRSVLSPTAQALPTLPSAKPTTPQPELSGPSPSSQATRSPAPPPAPAVRVRRNRQGHIGVDEQDSADDEDDDVEEDEEGWEMWDEEGEEWLDDDDGIEWADDEFGDVLELDPAEKELLTVLINYPNAEATLQRIMDGQTAEVMAEIQTANPRLFQLISENGLLFTEVMEDVKIEMESGNITNSAGRGASYTDEWTRYEHMRIDISLTRDQCQKLDATERVQPIATSAPPLSYAQEKELSVVSLDPIFTRLGH